LRSLRKVLVARVLTFASAVFFFPGGQLRDPYRH